MCMSDQTRHETSLGWTLLFVIGIHLTNIEFWLLNRWRFSLKKIFIWWNDWIAVRWTTGRGWVIIWWSLNRLILWNEYSIKHFLRTIFSLESFSNERGYVCRSEDDCWRSDWCKVRSDWVRWRERFGLISDGFESDRCRRNRVTTRFESSDSPWSLKARTVILYSPSSRIQSIIVWFWFASVVALRISSIKIR